MIFFITQLQLIYGVIQKNRMDLMDRMIKEKYTQLCLACQFGEINTIGLYNRWHK
jgi:hypothetical protein